ncbi:MAG: nucleotidyl transferase AbiEii/AbiGii toxin family protein [Gammaproteobacteria bacterium]
MTFEPQLGALPAAQRALWPELAQVPRHFVLYGGTAVALHYGHRTSADFDFFTSQPIQAETLLRTLTFLRDAKPTQVARNTLAAEVTRGGVVKLQFLGGLPYRRVCDPHYSRDNVAQVASPLDLLATKLRVIWERSQSKDFLDIHELLRRGVDLKNGLGAGYAVYAGQFNSHISLRALGYFDDGDVASLPQDVKQDLVSAVNSVLGQPLPEFQPLPGGLAPAKPD